MPGVSHRRFPSPLRYPGGKGKVANFLKLLVLKNELVGCEYAEPYAGGAGVALSLLYEEYVSHIHINDLDESIYAFWNAVLCDTEALCQRINDTEVRVEEWHRQRAVQEAKDPDPLDLAFSTFFLNRTNRSGIISGGIIGGLDQTGKWKLTARYNAPDLIRRIKKVARFKSRITLTKDDAADYIRETVPGLPMDALIYLDPPYYVKGQGLYRNAYDHADHKEIADLVPSIKQNWIVSYDADDAILDFYSDYEPLLYNLSYSAQDKYEGREVMFVGPGLYLPHVTSPANIRVATVDKTRRSVSLFAAG